ncbi:MAG: preprotein translocase subunit SecA [Desulfovibrio sp.]|jgi:preprotein translocase subunit SecA|nr:preprotein translocase subunit SecA [Desulfovibrio sp.]
MFSFLFKKIFGSRNERFLRHLRPLVKRINALEPEAQALADSDFRVRIDVFRKEIKDNNATPDSLLPEVFALTREASRRTLGLRHYDVQLVGGITLHRGKIAEMKTGEGKTLAATLAAVLNALSGRGVHVVTVNDYLARRDAAWMGKIYHFLGLTTGVIVHGLDDNERAAAYNADITYGTNNEFGFDYLRDNMKFYADQLVQCGHNFAIVDEVDSILVDEARTPLIISGASDESVGKYRMVDELVCKLEPAHYSIDEKTRTAMLTDAGVSRCEELLKVENLFDPANITLQHHVLQALKAHRIFRRDVDYIVKDDHVVIVDEFTGRLMDGRRYSDGLHQALEAKEHVTVAAENQTLASITFQNYFRLYGKLSGMTGTADTEAVEFQQIYNLEVVCIPPNKPMIRKDYPDMIYRSRQEKFDAITAAIADIHKQGQPVLVGTISIETSEMLSNRLAKLNIPHNVLNAKQHEKEAEIVAQAGQKGRVTIATNMAGRGTDIVLGEGVPDIGGLHILGTERHESRRIDNQLRGRSGRQGDLGSSRFYLSLEDDLMRLFGSDRIKGLMEKLGLRDGESIENAMVSRAVERAQKRVEAHHFEIRKALLDYDNVMNQQREVIYALRRDLMVEEVLDSVVDEFLGDVLDNEYAQIGNAGPDAEQEATALARLREIFNLDRVLPENATLPSREECEGHVRHMLEMLKADTGESWTGVQRYFLLEGLDRCWKEHLRNMDALRDGIGLRGYGQKDPKLEYKREGFAMFQEMLFHIRESVFRVLTRLRVEAPAAETAEKVTREYRHKEDSATGLSYSGGGEEPAREPVRAAPHVGRNDPCPCGSGLKYKKCCGR